MKMEWVLSVVLVLSVMGCDSEESAPVGEFSSALSTVEVTVENLTIAEKDTFCKEIVNYQAAKMSEACSVPSGVEIDASSACAGDIFVGCDATVAEIEECMGVVMDASFSHPLMAAMMGCSATAPDEALVAGCTEVQERCPEAFSGPDDESADSQVPTEPYDTETEGGESSDGGEEG